MEIQESQYVNIHCVELDTGCCAVNDSDETSKRFSAYSVFWSKTSSRENKETINIISRTKGNDTYTYPEYLARPQVLST